MPPRAGAGCVIELTEVIPQGMAPQPISTINVINEIVVNFAFNPPKLTPSISNPIGNVTPIKSLRVPTTYVYPVTRYKYTNDASYPLLRLQVKIPPAGVGITDDDCGPGDLCKVIICSFLHPFMNINRRIVPAYCVDPGTKIAVDPNPLTNQFGIVNSVTLEAPMTVVGLEVMDYANAAAVPALVPPLFDVVNAELAPLWEQNPNRPLPLRKLEAMDFAYSRFATLLSQALAVVIPPPPGPAPVLYGLQPEEFMIITELIATGTLDVQHGHYRETQNGIDLINIIP